MIPRPRAAGRQGHWHWHPTMILRQCAHPPVSPLQARRDRPGHAMIPAIFQVATLYTTLPRCAARHWHAGGLGLGRQTRPEWQETSTLPLRTGNLNAGDAGVRPSVSKYPPPLV
jgi:hypothetical protein